MATTGPCRPPWGRSPKNSRKDPARKAYSAVPSHGEYSEQTADHVLTACPIHRASHGARGLTILDDETRSWLNNITTSI